MHVLVVSHDYPPIPSPQAMRVGKLVEGLIADGCSVEVLTSVPAEPVDDSMQSDGLVVVRVVPSSAHQYLRKLRRGKGAGRMAADAGNALPKAMQEQKDDALAVSRARLNWKGRLASWIDRRIWGAKFPGIGRAWLPAAMRAYQDLLEKRRPDCIVFCHEPPVSLEVLARSGTAGIPVVVELGDPVCAPYTPGKWRRKSLGLESATTAMATRIVVTCEATRRLLIARHGIDPAKIVVLTQGFDPAFVHENERSRQPSTQLRLVYTGSFYSFRTPDALIDAVRNVPQAELVIVSRADSPYLPRDLPCNVRVTGEMSQREAVRMQERADILVNIANDGLPQIPGKFFEYLGQQLPILHLANDPADEQTAILSNAKRGWAVANDASEIEAFLCHAVRQHQQGTLRDEVNLDLGAVEEYSWARIGTRFADVARNASITAASPVAAMEKS